MALVPIENVGSLGIVLDVKPHEVPPEGWTAGQNIRFANNVAQKILGQATVFGTPTVSPHWLMPWQTPLTYYWIYAGTARVFKTDGTTHTVITRHTTSDGDNNYTAGTRPIWSGGNLHGVPILNHNNGTDYPQQYDATLSPERLKDLANWPASTYCKVMRPFRNFLVALDVTKSGTRYPHLLKWSHPADPGAVPVTWDETDATKLAGEQTIAQTGGYLVDCLPLADVNVVYKEDAIWTMQFVGGVYVFSFKEISQSLGLLAPRCVKSLDRSHFLVGTNDIAIFDGQRPRSVINRRMRSYFFNNISYDYVAYTLVVPNYAKREMWVCFVEQGATYLNLALVWNYDDNTWTIRELPDAQHLGYGQVTQSDVDSFDASSGTTFDADFGAFGSASLSAAELSLLIAQADGTTDAFYKADVNYDFSGTTYTSYLERLGLTVVGTDRQGNPKTDPSKVKFVRALYPKITCSGSCTINIYVGSHDTPDGNVTWEGPLTYNPATDVRVDCRVQGKFIAVRFEDTSTSSPWTLSGYSLDLDIVAGL